MFFENDIFKILKSNYIDEKIRKIEDDEIFQSIQSNISVNEYVGSILHFFIKIFDVKKILELGSLYGKSAILMANCAIDNDIFIYSIENNKKNFDLAKKNIQIYGLDNRIKVYLGDAMKILSTDENFPKDFEMVFVDANKLSYIDYLHWCEKYLEKGSILIFDNVFIHRVLQKYQDQNCQMFKKMEEFLKYISDEKLFNKLIIPYERDALCVLRIL